MAIRKFYLRQNYQAEIEHEDLTYPFPNHIRSLGALACQYRLGCSASLVPVLSMDSPIRETLDEVGLSMHAGTIPSSSSDAAWKFSSRSMYGDHLQSFAPWSDAVIIDNCGREPHDVGTLVLNALQENRNFIGRYDSSAGELFYMLDFMTNRSYRLDV